MTNPAPTLGYVRFVNAIPDSQPVDFVFVDKPENASFYTAPFRTTSVVYQGVAPGNRHLTVFNDGNCAGSNCSGSVASVVIWDSTFAIAANTYYTVLLTGYTKAGATPRMKGTVLTDNAPTPGAGQIAIRVINAMANPGTAIDVYGHAATGGTTATGTPLFSNVAYNGVSNYATVAAGPLALQVTPSGSTTVAADVLAPAGTAGTAINNPIPGSSIAGTVLTAIVVPRSTAGTGAPQTSAFTTPSVIYIWDRRPPNTAP